MTSKKAKSIRTGIFIDASNLFWASKKQENYFLDFLKLRKYLKSQFSPVFYHYYACEDENPSTEEFRLRAQKEKGFHKRLEHLGYTIVRKPLKHIGTETKGDMDVEIAMSITKHLNEVDNIVMFTGDSDFLSAVQTFHSAGKHIRIFSFSNTLSWELKDFAIKNLRCNYFLLDDLRDKLEFVKEGVDRPNL